MEPGEPLDERMGLPSASNFHRYEKCPGSFQLEREARRIGQAAHQGGEAASRGTRIHRWLEDPESITLPAEELELANSLKERGDEQVRRIFGDEPYTELREKRLWLRP